MSIKKNGDVIRMTPDVKQFIIDEFYCFVLMFVLLILSGLEYEIVAVCALIGALLLCFYLIGRWWYYKSLIWEINTTQIKSIKGIINKSTNFIEIFRVVDFAEQQTLLQQIFGLKDVYIISADRTDSILRIYGIPNNFDIITELKPLIKKCRKENGIYEIANP